MSWLSAAIRTNAETADPLSDALLAEGALSVTVTDAADGAFQEEPIFGEPGEFAGYWNECVVTALFAADADVATSNDNAAFTNSFCCSVCLERYPTAGDADDGRSA